MVDYSSDDLPHTEHDEEHQKYAKLGRRAYLVHSHRIQIHLDRNSGDTVRKAINDERSFQRAIRRTITRSGPSSGHPRQQYTRTIGSGRTDTRVGPVLVDFRGENETRTATSCDRGERFRRSSDVLSHRRRDDVVDAVIC